MDFREYQDLAKATDQMQAPDAGSTDIAHLVVPLLGLAGEAGELLSEYKKHLRDGETYPVRPDRIAEELGDLLWYLSTVATKFGLDLNEVAERNLGKTSARWPTRPHERALFDSDFPAEEQFPRQLLVEIATTDKGMVTMHVDGQRAGNDLSDNAYTPDGYGYHDIFHLAYTAVLGWSPVIRALLQRKRRSNSKVDEVEDGGRAIAIEEGIAAMVFSYAADYDYFQTGRGVGWDLLRTIKGMTAHLEVATRTVAEWEQAILIGFDAWHSVRSKGNGALKLDLESADLRIVNN